MSAVVALLRIGDKYIIPDLRKEAVNRICISYPSTLDEAEEIWDEPSVYNGIKDSSLLHNLFTAANAFHEGRVYSALPLIFLKCATQSLVSLVSAHSGDDPDLPAVRLHPDVLSTVMQGKEVMMRSYITTQYPWLRDVYRYGFLCSSAAACRTARARAAQRILAEVQQEWHEFREIYWTDDWVCGMCSTCEADAKKSFMQGAYRFWDSIPEAFGLGSWEEVIARIEY
jgi:hypothetical protein